MAAIILEGEEVICAFVREMWEYKTGRGWWG